MKHRLFPPPPEFAANAHIKSFEEYERLYAEAAADPEAFWAKQAESLDWFRKWDTVLEWNEPFAKWFVGGKINISYNCLDRHLTTWRKNKAAIIWEGEPGEIKNDHLSAASSGSFAICQCAQKASASRPATASRCICR